MKKLVLTLLISSFMITAAPAQKYESSGTLKIKKWSVAMYLGWKIGGPSKQIEKAMDVYGFNIHTRVGWFDSGKAYPYTNHSIPSWMLSVKYNLKSPFSIRIAGGMANLGRTNGNKRSLGGDHLISIDYSVFYISPIFSVNPYDIIRIGIGPSLNFKKARESSPHAEGAYDEYKDTKLGFIIDLGIRFPRKSILFFELNSQFRYVGNAEIGPFNTDPALDALPKTEVTFDHLFIGGGFGVRF